MIAGKTSLDYTNLFSPNDYQKNDKMVYSNFETNIANGNVSLNFRLKN